MIDFLSQPWPWWVGGPLLGLTVPLLMILTGKQLGIALCFKPPLSILFGKYIPFFNYPWRNDLWRLFFVLGIAIGGFIGIVVLPQSSGPAISASTVADLQALGIHDFSSLLPSELFGAMASHSLPVISLLIGGGFLIGFGSRYANGCTSGHAIMGLSYFQLASLIAAVGFFIGGILMTYLILPLLLGGMLK